MDIKKMAIGLGVAAGLAISMACAVPPTSTIEPYKTPECQELIHRLAPITAQWYVDGKFLDMSLRELSMYGALLKGDAELGNDVVSEMIRCGIDVDATIKESGDDAKSKYGGK